MAIIEPRETLPTPEEKVAAILRQHRPRSFEELLGPEPLPGSEGEVDEFLGWLEERRRIPKLPE